MNQHLRSVSWVPNDSRTEKSSFHNSARIAGLSLQDFRNCVEKTRKLNAWGQGAHKTWLSQPVSQLPPLAWTHRTLQSTRWLREQTCTSRKVLWPSSTWYSKCLHWTPERERACPGGQEHIMRTNCSAQPILMRSFSPPPLTGLR